MPVLGPAVADGGEHSYAARRVAEVGEVVVHGFQAAVRDRRDRILAATIHLRDMGDFAAMNAVWEAWLPAGAAPARTTVEARLATPELLVEITLIAAT